MKLEDIVKSQKHGLLTALSRALYDCVGLCSRDEIETHIFKTMEPIYEEDDNSNESDPA